MYAALLSHHAILLCNIKCSREHTVHPRHCKSVQEVTTRQSGTVHKDLNFAFPRRSFCLKERVVYKDLQISLKGRKKHPGITGRRSKPMHSLAPLYTQPADVSLQTQRVIPFSISSSSPCPERANSVWFMLCATTRWVKFPDPYQGLFFALGHKTNVMTHYLKDIYFALKYFQGVEEMA